MKAPQKKKADVKNLFVKQCLELLEKENSLECIIKCRKDIGGDVRTHYMTYEAFLNRGGEPCVYGKEEISFRAGYSGFYSSTPFNHALMVIREEFENRKYRILDEDIRETGDSLISRVSFKVNKN